MAKSNLEALAERLEDMHNHIWIPWIKREYLLQENAILLAKILDKLESIDGKVD